ncbi:hypothetical protein AL755_21295 [Arthrobacter sp. ERGS1:01]|nr:hypothetical protein AL755_21295 [Arthrobacter sp. ERGS1:01]
MRCGRPSMRPCTPRPERQTLPPRPPSPPVTMPGRRQAIRPGQPNRPGWVRWKTDSRFGRGVHWPRSSSGWTHSACGARPEGTGGATRRRVCSTTGRPILRAWPGPAPGSRTFCPIPARPTRRPPERHRPSPCANSWMPRA